MPPNRLSKTYDIHVEVVTVNGQILFYNRKVVGIDWSHVPDLLIERVKKDL